MDPYLESHWRDVHAAFVVYASDELNEILPTDLRARLNARRVRQPDWGAGPVPGPAIRAIRWPSKNLARMSVGNPPATVEPFIVEADREPLDEGYIEILDSSDGNRVVTIIELLTPADKRPGEGTELYRDRQIDVIRSETSLVEIDLLRVGRHITAVALENIPRTHRAPYMVCVRRAWVRDKAQVYSIFLSQRLPTIKVPLRQGEAEVPLDLQALIDRCYRMGRYEGDLDYRKDADPPLTAAEAEWAEELLRSKGLRPARPANEKRKRKPPRSSGEK
jgi:hypothetical protein